MMGRRSGTAGDAWLVAFRPPSRERTGHPATVKKPLQLCACRVMPRLARPPARVRCSSCVIGRRLASAVGVRLAKEDRRIVVMAFVLFTFECHAAGQPCRHASLTTTRCHVRRGRVERERRRWEGGGRRGATRNQRGCVFPRAYT